MDPTNENENISAISSDLIRGHINTIILRTLYDGDKYGYEIINEIEEKSKGQYSLKQPTLYSALKRLESQDFVTSYWGGVSNGGRRKYFQITDKGKKIVEQNLAEWEYSRTVIDSLISEKDYDFSNPPPSAVDFSLLKKSTTRVRSSGDLSHDDIDLEAYNEEAPSADAHEEIEEISASTSADTATEEGASAEESAAAQQTVPESDDRESVSVVQTDESYENVPYPIENVYTEAEQDASVNQSGTAQTDPEPQQQAAEARSSYTYSQSVQESNESEPSPAQHDPWIDEEQRRIQHENYRNLVGDEDDATAYYYAQVARQNREQRESAAASAAETAPVQEPVYQSEAPQQEETSPYGGQAATEYDDTYLENRAISSELLYSNRSPAERNYKDLLSRLYDNTRHEPEEPYYEVPPQEEAPPVGYETADMQQSEPTPEPQPTDVAQDTVAHAEQVYTDAAPASNVEFYDIAEHAENDGIRITTSNGARNRNTPAKTVGNVFDKGKALFMSALYVFVIALIECIVNLCIRGAIDSHPAYVVLPFVATFVMFGVFLFLYLKGYGKNSRKTQSRSYISASLILFANLVIIICLIAYLIIYNANTGVTFVQILKFGILPCIFVFNIPLFAIFYSYHSNKQ